MKNYLLFVVGLVLTSCSDQLSVGNVADAAKQQAVRTDVGGLIEKARWGDGKAYLQLANRYHDGLGVKQDFINMLSMAYLASEYGGISHLEEYIQTLPSESEYRQVFEAMGKNDTKNHEEALSIADGLIARGCPEGYAVKSIITAEQGDRTEGERLMKAATESGSSFASLYLCTPQWHKADAPDIAILEALVDKLPIANACLAKIYLGKWNSDLKDERLAAYYFMKADEKACLTRDGASWLLAYYRSGGDLRLSEKDIERLERLAGPQVKEPEEAAEIIADSIGN